MLFDFQKTVFILVGTLILNIFYQKAAFSFAEQENPSFVVPEEIQYKFDFNQYRKEKVDKFYSENTALFHKINSQLDYWSDLNNSYKNTGFQISNSYSEIVREAKIDIIKDEVLRHFKRVTREPLKNQLKEWQRGIQRNFEIDERNQLLGSDSVFVYSEESYKALKERKKSKNVITKKIQISNRYKLRIKPRVLRGLLIVDFFNPFIRVNSTFGVNGELDLNLSKRIDKIGLFAAFNYNLQEKRILLNIDKSITPNLALRISTEKYRTNELNLSDKTLFSLNYFLRF